MDEDEDEDEHEDKHDDECLKLKKTIKKKRMK